MHLIRSISASLAFTMMFSCGSDNAPPPVSIANHTAVQAEDYSESVEGGALDWVLITLEDDDSTAVKLVGRDDADSNDSQLPTLIYEIDFPETGQYALNLRGRQDSLFASDKPVYLTFGADEGDMVWPVSGLDDQWNWYNTDDTGQQMLATVATNGVHQFSISSSAQGLLLDQLTFTLTANDSGQTQEQPDPVPPYDEDQNTSATTADTNDDVLTDDPQLPTENKAPVVSVSADSVAHTGLALGLNASGNDDGKPHGGLYYYWTKTAGPGNASFSARQSSLSSVTFDQPGNYTVQVTVSDGQLYTNATHNVQVIETESEDESAQDQNASNDEEPTNHSDTTGNVPNNLRWHALTTRGSVSARHETGGVVVNGKLYVIGGRGDRPVEVYDPQDNTWQRISNAPIEMHHFQPVAIGTKIYIVGAFTCCYPQEEIIDRVYVFDTATHRWSKGAKLPVNRKRGSAGAVVYNRKIYLIGGNTKGHSGGAVKWFDEFDPSTGRWKVLPAAPDARDHVTVAVVNSKLVVAGGRKTNTPIPFANTVSRTNVYDFQTGRWSSEANIPTQRAGTMTVAVGDEVVVIGGESTAGTSAHRDVEAYNVKTRKWRTLDKLRTARHGGAAGVLNGAIHVVAGNTTRGGGRETSAHEVLR